MDAQTEDRQLGTIRGLTDMLARTCESLEEEGRLDLLDERARVWWLALKDERARQLRALQIRADHDHKIKVERLHQLAAELGYQLEEPNNEAPSSPPEVPACARPD